MPKKGKGRESYHRRKEDRQHKNRRGKKERKKEGRDRKKEKPTQCKERLGKTCVPSGNPKVIGSIPTGGTDFSESSFTLVVAYIYFYKEHFPFPYSN